MSDLISTHIDSSSPAAATPVWRDGACSAHIAVVGDTILATISGAVDRTSIDDFDGHLAAACSAGPTRVVLDMADVEFLCADGLASLHEAANAVVNAGGAFAVSGSRAVTRPLRRTGLARFVPVYDWLPTAFEAVGGRFAVV